MKSFVLVDCNNFYASCERLFDPKLDRLPVIVLSNNDGCIVARSQEAKDLGIGMGEPFFKVRQFCEAHKVVVYSSNYQLYGDMSARVMNILTSMAPDIEIYSIDEAFLKFPEGMEGDALVAHCKQIRRKVKRWVGMPISLGIAPTKTLAKAASKLAKKSQDGVCDLSTREAQDAALKQFPVGDLWGVGRNSRDKLHGLGIRTASEFRDMDPVFVRKQMGVVGERMVRELQGTSCLSLEMERANKSIICSRSFGSAVTREDHLLEALAGHAALAAEKLREQRGCAAALLAYAEAYIEGSSGMRRSYSGTAAFPLPTNDTAQLIGAARKCLPQVFHPGERYKKCGVILLDLIPEKNVIPDLFLGGHDPKRQRLLETVDALNGNFGKGTIFYGSMGTKRPWKMRCENRSKRYTTCWKELPIVK